MIYIYNRSSCEGFCFEAEGLEEPRGGAVERQPGLAEADERLPVAEETSAALEAPKAGPLLPRQNIYYIIILHIISYYIIYYIMTYIYIYLYILYI